MERKPTEECKICDVDYNGSLEEFVGLYQLNLSHGCSVHLSINEGFGVMMDPIQASDQKPPFSDYSAGDKGLKISVSHEEEPNESTNADSDTDKASEERPWRRMRWTDEMVKLLITVVSYMAEDVSAGRLAGRKFVPLQGNGKWKLVSRIMAVTGHQVSPQQCEDKFNGLNKRYKKLNVMLGRGTACEVVETPALLDLIDYLTEKEKEEVRKILSSKQLFYEEMCSYNNRNRIFLPHDPSVQRLVRVALRNRLDFNGSTQPPSCSDEVLGAGDAYQDVEIDHPDGHEEMVSGDPSQGQWNETRAACVEEQRLRLQEKTLELETQRLRWVRRSRKEARRLEKLRMENERMRLENERMAVELKRMGSGMRL